MELLQSCTKPLIWTSLNWVLTGSDNDLSPVRRQAISWTSDDLCSLDHQEQISEVSIPIQIFIKENVFEKVICKLVLASMFQIMSSSQCMTFIFSRTAIWGIWILRSTAWLMFVGPYISMIWKKHRSFNSHVGYVILRSNSLEEFFIALTIELIIKSNMVQLTWDEIIY